MIAAKLLQRYDTRSLGALEVLLHFSVHVWRRGNRAYLVLVQHMLCIVVAVRCRNATSGSSSSRRWRSAGSSAASTTALRNSVERVEASSNAASDSLTSVLASTDG